MFLKHINRVTHLKAVTMAQAVSRQPFAAEDQVRARLSPCGICDLGRGTETGFSLSSLVFPIDIVPPWLCILVIIWGMNIRPFGVRSSETVSPHRHEHHHKPLLLCAAQILFKHLASLQVFCPQFYSLHSLLNGRLYIYHSADRWLF
jgi:hypothetical protein